MQRKPFDFDHKSHLGLAGKVKKKWEEPENQQVEELGEEAIINHLKEEIEKIAGNQASLEVIKKDIGTRYTITWSPAGSQLQNIAYVIINSQGMQCKLVLYRPKDDRRSVFFKSNVEVMLHGNKMLPVSSEAVNVILYQMKKALRLNESINLGLNNKVKKKFDKISVEDQAERIGSPFKDPILRKWLREKRGILSISDCEKIEYFGNMSKEQYKFEGFFEGCQMETFNEFKYFSSLKVISPHSFGKCDKLREIEIPSSVKIIESNAFYECESLEKIVIPEGVRAIDNYAFNLCNNLKEIWLPDSIEMVGNSKHDSPFKIISQLTYAFSNKSDIKFYLRKTCKASLHMYTYCHKKNLVWCDKDWNPIEDK